MFCSGPFSGRALTNIMKGILSPLWYIDPTDVRPRILRNACASAAEITGYGFSFEPSPALSIDFVILSTQTWC